MISCNTIASSIIFLNFITYVIFQDGAGKLLTVTAGAAVSTPPTPFADRETLEAELLAIEREIGTIKLARQLQSSLQAAAEGEETVSVSSLTMPELSEAGPNLAALRHLKADDIDSFIANMAVPPPPTKQVQYKQHSPIVELTSEDISAFIIPPPPGGGGELLAGYQSSSGGRLLADREVQEMKVAKEMVEMTKGGESRGMREVSPKSASLQERISLLKGQEVTREGGGRRHRR